VRKAAAGSRRLKSSRSPAEARRCRRRTSWTRERAMPGGWEASLEEVERVSVVVGACGCWAEKQRATVWMAGFPIYPLKASGRCPYAPVRLPFETRLIERPAANGRKRAIKGASGGPPDSPVVLLRPSGRTLALFLLDFVFLSQCQSLLVLATSSQRISLHYCLPCCFGVAHQQSGKVWDVGRLVPDLTPKGCSGNSSLRVL
jgi:hypothetical protein